MNIINKIYIVGMHILKLDQYNEKLKINPIDSKDLDKLNVKSSFLRLKYFPKNRRELKDIIEKRLAEEGRDTNLNDIDVSQITDVHDLFKYEYFFGDVSLWNVSNVENMSGMFYDCDEFDGDLSKWNVSNVKNMNCMFYGCSIFNQSLNNWNVSNVEEMINMFYKCKSFNQSLNDWDVSNVTDMQFMFYRCNNFNQPLNKWNVSNVKDMTGLFAYCEHFNQDLSSWNLSKLHCQIISMFSGCGIDCENMPEVCKSYNY